MHKELNQTIAYKDDFTDISSYLFAFAFCGMSKNRINNKRRDFSRFITK